MNRRTVLLGVAAATALAAVGGAAAAEEPKVPPTRSPKRAPVPSMPVGYVSHGAPSKGLNSAWGKELAAWTASQPKPVAVLCISAHYQRRPITIGATTRRPLLYDFRGFPRALYSIKYDAPPAPKLGRRVQEVLAPLGKVQVDPRRGHDHGTWVPLRWMYAKADVPILSVSLPSQDPKTLFKMGQALRPLRDEGVFILGSGGMTHNLRKRLPRGAKTPTWAAEFDAWATEALRKHDVDALLDWQRKAPAARTNHPTVEHFVPLLIAAGARREKDVATFPLTGFDGGSFSKRCVAFGPSPKKSG